MEIRIRATGAVMFENEFRAMHPNTSFPPVLTPELLDSMGADPVFEGPQATGASVYQYSQRQGVEEVDGKWFTKYVLGPVFQDTTAEDGTVTTAAEHEAAYKAAKDAEQAKAVREDRNRRLAETDWTQLQDAPVNQQAWANYRQALRDVTAQSGFPWDIAWPEKPTA